MIIEQKIFQRIKIRQKNLSENLSKNLSKKFIKKFCHKFRQMIQESKFLGGYMEQTHLVKGKAENLKLALVKRS